MGFEHMCGQQPIWPSGHQHHRWEIAWRRRVNDNPEELVAFCKTRLAGFKVPKTVIIRASLPLSPAGKLMKRELKQELLATAQRAQP